MSDLVSGLVGIVVGGVLTGAVDQVGAWRKRKRDLRTAARLVFADYVQSELSLDVALAEDDWWPESIQPLVEDWQQYRQDLAAEMSPKHLDTVQGAFHQVWSLMKVRDAGDEPFKTWRVAVEGAKEAVSEAGGVLLIYGRNWRPRIGLGKQADADESEDAP